MQVEWVGGGDLEHLRAAVAELLGGRVGGESGLLDLHPMLVGAGAEDGGAALELLPALEDVRDDH